MLEAAFNFKTECLKIEEKLLTFSQTNDSKIDLNYFYKDIKTVNNNDHSVASSGKLEMQILRVEIPIYIFFSFGIGRH